MTTDSNVNYMSLQDTLLAYSEWLDSEHLIESDKSGDDRTHDQLAQQFISYWQSNPNRAVLAGVCPCKNRPELRPEDIVALPDHRTPPEMAGAAANMYNAAQTILETGGAVEIGGVRITRAEDAHIPVTQMMVTLDQLMSADTNDPHIRLSAARLVAEMIGSESDLPTPTLSDDQIYATVESIDSQLADLQLAVEGLVRESRRGKKSKKNGKRR